MKGVMKDGRIAVRWVNNIPLVINMLRHSALASDLQSGKKLHGIAITCGMQQTNVVVGTAILDMYAKCKSVKNASKLFDKMPTRDTVTWNAIIGGYVHNNLPDKALKTLQQMLSSNILPTSVTLLSSIAACSKLEDYEYGKQAHALSVITGFTSDAEVTKALIDMYGKCRYHELAKILFDNVIDKNVFSWGAMVLGYAQNGCGDEALAHFRAMLHHQLIPDKTSLIGVCSIIEDPQHGKIIHSLVAKTGHLEIASILTALVTMYTRCGAVKTARHIFDRIIVKDSVAWNAMISAYAQNGYPREAIMVFSSMLGSNARPNRVCILNILPCFGDLDMLEQGEAAHCLIVEEGLENDEHVKTALLGMYNKCGRIDLARKVFDGLHEKDNVPFNAMIYGHIQNGDIVEAIFLLKQMLELSLRVDDATISCLLPSCVEQVSLGEVLHGYSIKSGVISYVYVVNSLIHMYATIGGMDKSCRVFEENWARDTVTWTAMISGCIHNDMDLQALGLFTRMMIEDFRPDATTLVVLVPACYVLNTIQTGKMIHGYVIKSGFSSDVPLNNSLIDMYAKCGELPLSLQVFRSMPERSSVSWNAMIGAYGLHGDCEGALGVFYEMRKSGTSPNGVTLFSVLCACRHAGLVDEGKKWFKYMTECCSIVPTNDHFSCMVDLLARAGHLQEALDFIQQMPFSSDPSLWASLLTGCRIHDNVRIGEYALERLKSNPSAHFTQLPINTLKNGRVLEE